MVNLLNRYAKTSFDILGHLPSGLSSRVLAYLRYDTLLLPSFLPSAPSPDLNPPPLFTAPRLPELLACELVSKNWLSMCRHEDLYELLVRRLTRHDPFPPRDPHLPASLVAKGDNIPGYSGEEGTWRAMYHALYHRERNWAWGNPQSIK